MSTTTFIVDFSNEVLCLIIDQLPFSSHFDFACTCKRLAVASQYVLRRHQEAYAKFLVASDLDRTTVPLLLESAFGTDKISAWHVRSFEVWRDRTSSDEWETYSLYTPVNFGLDEIVSDLNIMGLQQLLGKVGRHLDWHEEYSYEGINREKAFAQLERGCDGLLKALLVAKLPRLRDLKLVTRSQVTGSTLSWLKTLIASSKGVYSESKPTHHIKQEDPYTCDETAEEREDVTKTRRHFERLATTEVLGSHAATTTTTEVLGSHAATTEVLGSRDTTTTTTIDVLGSHAATTEVLGSCDTTTTTTIDILGSHAATTEVLGSCDTTTTTTIDVLGSHAATTEVLGSRDTTTTTTIDVLGSHAATTEVLGSHAATT
ncbi:hypothetical protein EKO04_004173 [Ascochyta lentis]|uniref:F-box domain-containing protein n=1 Tax=Ascochyta lentis TaxID=205686 RepID=A0A8H7J470_9PLEO|nr:hypothetical protein EKO04_004173 [Ascochyta lentis]